MYRALAITLTIYAVMAFLLGCKAHPQIEAPQMSEAKLIESTCAAKEKALRNVTIVTSGEFTLYMSSSDVCAKRRPQGLALANPSGRKAPRGVAVVDGVYGANNVDIANDLQRTRKKLEESGWIVVDTANLTPAEAEAKVAAARKANPDAFGAEIPFHVLQVAHGQNAGDKGLVLETNEGSQTQTHDAQQRVGGIIRGAGSDVQADLLVSACYSGSFKPEATGIKPQLRSVVTSSDANSVSFASRGSEQALQAYRETMANPAGADRSGNKNGQVEIDEVFNGEVNPVPFRIESVYRPDDKGSGEWVNTTYQGNNEVPLGRKNGGEYALPDATDKKLTGHSEAPFLDLDQRYHYQWDVDVGQRPQTLIAPPGGAVIDVPPTGTEADVFMQPRQTLPTNVPEPVVEKTTDESAVFEIPDEKPVVKAEG